MKVTEYYVIENIDHHIVIGMLRRWDDSQRYLSDNPDLVCEETANYLVIMCIDLEVEEVKSTKTLASFISFQFL